MIWGTMFSINHFNTSIIIHLDVKFDIVARSAKQIEFMSFFTYMHSINGHLLKTF